VFDDIAAWIRTHALLDFLVQVAVGTLAVAATVAAVCLTAYLALFLLRLLGRENRDRFKKQPIPHVTGGELFGAKIGLAAVREITAAEIETVEALKGLNERVATLEEALQRAEGQIGRMEDTSGRLPAPGGGHG
jgi:hypothetical protein